MSDEWVVTMPKLGETVTEGTVGGWRKQVGDSIEFDDPLFEVSTDKVDTEVPSPVAGALTEIHAQEVTAPDLTDGPTGPVVVSLPSTRCTGPVVEQLKDVLGTHPGVTEVQLKLLSRDSTKVLRLADGLRVTPSPALFADLKQLLGPGCLQG